MIKAKGIKSKESKIRKLVYGEMGESLNELVRGKRVSEKHRKKEGHWAKE